MNYFSKIEAYFLGELQEEEHRLFEEELATSTLLQQEVEAYELAQDLFGFAAEHLSEETIIATDTKETVEALISFTANNLSEDQILAPTPVVGQAAITRTLQPRRNRRAWLVAASMLLILSMIGSQFYTSQLQKGTIETPVAINTPLKKVITEPTNLVVPTKINPAKEVIVEEAQPNKVLSKNRPAKAQNRTTKPQELMVNLVKKEKKTLVKRPVMPTVEPLVFNLTAQEITTQKVINSGESVIYSGAEAVTLKAGFHAQAGADFTATSGAIVSTTLSVNEVVEGKQPVILKAAKAITMKPGFHVNSETAFVAKATTKKESENIAINTVISPNEEVVFKAGNTIILKPGFHAKAGAAFVATIGQ